MGLFRLFKQQTLEGCMAAYGGIFIVSSILWGAIVDKKNPDKYEIIGLLIVLSGEQ